MFIKAQLETTKEKILFFALAKGWEPKIFDALGMGIDNPESAIQFVEKYAKQVLKEQITDPFIQEVLFQSRQSAEVEIKKILQGTGESLTVIIE